MGKRPTRARAKPLGSPPPPRPCCSATPVEGIHAIGPAGRLGILREWAPAWNAGKLAASSLKKARISFGRGILHHDWLRLDSHPKQRFSGRPRIAAAGAQSTPRPRLDRSPRRPRRRRRASAVRTTPARSSHLWDEPSTARRQPQVRERTAETPCEGGENNRRLSSHAAPGSAGVAPPTAAV